MLSRKVMIIDSIVGQIKKISLHKMSYYSEPDSHSRNKIKDKLDLFNYATKPKAKTPNRCQYI